MTHINPKWLYEHLRPFLKRLDDKDGWEALRECVDREFMTEEEMEAILTKWNQE